MEKKAILVSACLLGVNCRYNGSGGYLQDISELMQLAHLVPVCPEILGGLPTPRPPAERMGERVVTCEGGDVTAQYMRGAEESVKLAKLYGAQLALMKERSPSCGQGQVYDGTFTKTLVEGDGLTARALKDLGIPVYGESEIEQLL